MEQTQDSALFGLGIDPSTKGHLSEAARWAKFLAIVGFICCGLTVLFGLFFGTIFSRLGNSNPYSTYDDNNAAITGAMGAAMAVVYIVIALIWFFSFLFLYKFATKMRVALATNDQEVLNASFQNLKIMFRYVGIITIIVLAIYVLMLLVILAGAGASRM